MTRWLAILVFAVVPSLAHAEGWFLMVPPTTPLPVPLGTPVTDAWQQAHEAHVQADLRAPVAKWEQHKAFDSARACEAELASIKNKQVDWLQSNSRRMMTAAVGSSERDMAWRLQIIHMGNMARWDQARCLAASQVPVR